jgi:LCP family protein required for cell wall assembly
LFGVDQETGSVGRSDAIMILSIDKENNKIKLTSLARDSLVPIQGHGEEKLTHAWAYGHAKLALKTINQAFGMNITDYAYVNFGEFIELIDYVGGVDIHINELELHAINNGVGGVRGVGVQRLNGKQALAYARCRADSDKNRTARQREVLIAVYEQVRKQPIGKLPDTLKKVLRLCHTTLNSDELMDMAKWAVLGTPTIESLSLPNAQLKPWSGILDRARGWVYVYDLDAAKKVLYNFIYEVDTKVSGVTQYVPATTTQPDLSTTTTTIPQ